MSIVVYDRLYVEFFILNSSELHTNAIVIVMSHRREKEKGEERDRAAQLQLISPSNRFPCAIVQR